MGKRYHRKVNITLKRDEDIREFLFYKNLFGCDTSVDFLRILLDSLKDPIKLRKVTERALLNIDLQLTYLEKKREYLEKKKSMLLEFVNKIDVLTHIEKLKEELEHLKKENEELKAKLQEYENMVNNAKPMIQQNIQIINNINTVKILNNIFSAIINENTIYEYIIKPLITYIAAKIISEKKIQILNDKDTREAIKFLCEYLAYSVPINNEIISNMRDYEKYQYFSDLLKDIIKKLKSLYVDKLREVYETCDELKSSTP